MTTPQLPPLPEPYCVHHRLDRSGSTSYFSADQMRAYALAAISTRPVSESIHEANAKTLQALVDELREMLGVKEGESLTASVRFLQEDRRSIATALARLARDYYGDPA